MKLTCAQKREMLILRGMYSIITKGYGSRFNLLLRLKARGLVQQGPFGHENVFTMTVSGKEYMNTNYQNTK